jgi:hypothetical protein
VPQIKSRPPRPVGAVVAVVTAATVQLTAVGDILGCGHVPLFIMRMRQRLTGSPLCRRWARRPSGGASVVVIQGRPVGHGQVCRR